MLQTGEIVIIAILALIVLGPQRLPEMARKIGGWTRELRAAAREITSGLEAEVKELKEVKDELKEMREELKIPLDDVKKPFTEIRDEVGEVGRGYQWKGPKPVSGPTPEDAMRDLERLEAEREQNPAPSDSEE